MTSGQAYNILGKKAETASGLEQNARNRVKYLSTEGIHLSVHEGNCEGHDAFNAYLFSRFVR